MTHQRERVQNPDGLRRVSEAYERMPDMAFEELTPAVSHGRPRYRLPEGREPVETGAIIDWDGREFEGNLVGRILEKSSFVIEKGGFAITFPKSDAQDYNQKQN